LADSLLRQWEMLKLIPRDRTITVREIKAKLDGLGYRISSRSIERDLDKLSIPFCLESDTQQRPYRWRFALNMPLVNIPGLTSSEALSLVLLETYLLGLLPVAIADNLSPHFAAARHYFTTENNPSKLVDWLKKVKVVSPGQPLLAPKINPNIQRSVNDALLQGMQLEMDYLGIESATAKHYSAVHLQGLIQYGVVVYLVAMINNHNDLRLLALHRIQQIKLVDIPARELAGFDLHAYVDQGGLGFNIDSPELITLRATFKHKAGQHLIDTPLATNQHIERIDSDTLIVTAQLFDTVQLQRWLSSFGPDVEVQAPEVLRLKLAERHQRAAQQYLPN
jgi:predicted DNA-binding transcriptional regulator YafY